MPDSSSLNSSLFEQRCREITFTRIRQECNDCFSFIFCFVCFINSSMKSSTRCNTDEYSFFSCQKPCRSICFIFRHPDYPIVYFCIKDFRNKSGPNSLESVRSRFAAGKNGKASLGARVKTALGFSWTPLYGRRSLQRKRISPHSYSVCGSTSAQFPLKQLSRPVPAICSLVLPLPLCSLWKIVLLHYPPKKKKS